MEGAGKKGKEGAICNAADPLDSFTSFRTLLPFHSLPILPSRVELSILFASISFFLPLFPALLPPFARPILFGLSPVSRKIEKSNVV